ncbi:MAG: energy transducer TonB [Nitrospiria bacterium]
MVSYSEMADPGQKTLILPPEPSERQKNAKSRKLSEGFWAAIIVTLIVHVIVAMVIYFFVPQKYAHRNSQPLEVILLTPPPQTLPPKPPPPPPRPKQVRVEKPEPKPLPPPIQPVVTPSPEPEVKSEEPPLPVAPPEEPPLPVLANPVEAPIVLPEYEAAYLRNIPPVYPPIAKRMRIEGSVRLRVFVSSAGLPKEIEIVQSSGSTILDDAAVKAVQNWSFVPAKKGTDPVAAWVEIPIKFSLINK